MCAFLELFSYKCKVFDSISIQKENKIIRSNLTNIQNCYKNNNVLLQINLFKITKHNWYYIIMSCWFFLLFRF